MQKTIHNAYKGTASSRREAKAKQGTLLAILTACLLSGCANIRIDESRMNNFEWVQNYSGYDIAIDYHNIRTRRDPNMLKTINCVAWSYGTIDPRVLAHYEKALVHKGLAPEHISLIRRGEIRIGMNEIGLYAAWGRPRDTNTDHYSHGKHCQHIYGPLGSPIRPRKYVYTRNKVITSFSTR